MVGDNEGIANFVNNGNLDEILVFFDEVGIFYFIIFFTYFFG